MRIEGSRSAFARGRPPYRLSDHVHACRNGRHILLLDLRRDCYLGITDTSDGQLEHWIAGWPRHTGFSSQDCGRDEIGQEASTPADLERMLQEGLLSINVEGYTVPPRSCDSIVEPRRALIEGYDRIDVAVTFLDAVRYTQSLLKARTLLRFRSLEYVIGRVARRRKRHQPTHRRVSDSAKDELQLRDRVAVYTRLTPFGMTTSNACLRNALAMSEFLAWWGFYPHWIFGVAVEPFAAHCWLQDGEVVVNDTPERVSRYTPILVV